MIDLNLLATFEALDKARSVSGAARLLGLSQPATSAALARLRKAMGDELFSYSGGEMQPTAAARRIGPGLLAALADIRALLDAERSFDPSTARASFTIGITDFASVVIGPALLAQMAVEAPGIDIRLEAYDKTSVAALIDGSGLDLVIGSFANPPDRSVATPLLIESLVGVARAGHPALLSPLDAARFASLDHALFTLGRDARGVVDDRLAMLGLERRVRLSLPHLMAMPDVLRATDLVAVVPSRGGPFRTGYRNFRRGFPWHPGLDTAHAVVAICPQ